MFFRKRREARERIFARQMLEYIGRDAFAYAMKAGVLPADHQKLGEVDLVCVVTRIQNFESIASRLSLHDLADQMNKFYGAVADAILLVEGDIKQVLRRLRGGAFQRVASGRGGADCRGRDQRFS